MQLIRVLKYILSHPFNNKRKLAALLRFIGWQLKARLSSQPVAHQFTQHSKIWAWKGLAGATGNIYCGLHEFDDMAFLLHFLRKEDLFADIGANIGSYTILASAEIGATTVSVEPVPATFGILNQNIALNEMESLVECHNIGLGSKRSLIRFTSDQDSVNHVATDEVEHTIEVEVHTLDAVLAGRVPILIKIDVEGYETEVISGAQETLNSEKLCAVILELNGAGARYGFNEQLLHEQLLSLGYKTFQYDPFLRVLKPVNSFGIHNTLYLKNMELINERVRMAVPVIIQGQSI